MVAITFILTPCRDVGPPEAANERFGALLSVEAPPIAQGRAGVQRVREDGVAGRLETKRRWFFTSPGQSSLQLVITLRQVEESIICNILELKLSFNHASFILSKPANTRD